MQSSDPIRLPLTYSRKGTDAAAVRLGTRFGMWCRKQLRIECCPADLSRRIRPRGPTVRAPPPHERESCKGRNRRGETSTAAEQGIIQRGAAMVALVILALVAIDLKCAWFIDVIVDENTFLAGRSFKASAQQLRDVG